MKESTRGKGAQLAPDSEVGGKEATLAQIGLEAERLSEPYVSDPFRPSDVGGDIIYIDPDVDGTTHSGERLCEHVHEDH